jgi:hypothetical protein
MQPAPLAENVGFGRRRCRLGPRALLRRARSSGAAQPRSGCCQEAGRPFASRARVVTGRCQFTFAMCSHFLEAPREPRGDLRQGEFR